MVTKPGTAITQERIMKPIGQIVALLIGVSLLGAMVFGVYLGLQYILALFASLDPQVAIVTGIGCLVALIAAWGIARSLRAAIRQSKAAAWRGEKTATYQLFVDFWENGVVFGRRTREQRPADLREDLQP